MTIPGTLQQLLIILVAVLPGVIYQTTRTRLVGPSPHNSDATARLLRAIGASVFFDTVYLILFGPWLVQTTIDARPCAQPQPVLSDPASGTLSHPVCNGAWTGALRDLALAGFALLVLVPAATALTGVLAGRNRWLQPTLVRWLRPAAADTGRLPRARSALANRVEGLGYQPTLTWDFALTSRGPCYVRILSSSQQWIGGWFGLGSFVAAYPEAPAIYLEEAWELDADGTFVTKVDETGGMYVPCADVVTVEFLMGSETDALAGTSEAANLVDTITGSTDTEGEEVP